MDRDFVGTRNHIHYWYSLLKIGNSLNLLILLKCRFIFCRAVLALYTPVFNNKQNQPECFPSLPEFLLPAAPAIQAAVLQMANVFGGASKFTLPQDITML